MDVANYIPQGHGRQRKHIKNHVIREIDTGLLDLVFFVSSMTEVVS